MAQRDTGRRFAGTLVLHVSVAKANTGGYFALVQANIRKSNVYMDA